MVTLFTIALLGSPAAAAPEEEVTADHLGSADTKKSKAKDKAKTKPAATRSATTAEKTQTRAKAKATAPKPPVARPSPSPSRPMAVGPNHGGGGNPGAGTRVITTNRPTRAAPATRAASPVAVRATAREVGPRYAHPVVKVKVVHTVPLYRTRDHRFARPNPFVVVRHPLRPAPAYSWYRPRWTHWWVHPYWRWTHATGVVVRFDYTPDPWADGWAPPSRDGWVWMPGHRAGGAWIPGHWRPVQAAPAWLGANWVWVPGWWMGGVWVEGHWRRDARPGWRWADGYYLDDGSFVRGWWEPDAEPPQEGYVWEAGFWDGQYWVEGFWRPQFREGMQWVSAWLDDEGVFNTGYWEPVDDRSGMVWIPGWFDGTEWVEGEWVAQAEYDQAEPESWVPEAGWDEGAAEERAVLPEDSEPPPALPYAGPPGG